MIILGVKLHDTAGKPMHKPHVVVCPSLPMRFIVSSFSPEVLSEVAEQIDTSQKNIKFHRQVPKYKGHLAVNINSGVDVYPVLSCVFCL